jgi:hypothetical protein
MKITCSEEKYTLVKLSTIKNGEVFEYDGTFYIKTNERGQSNEIKSLTIIDGMLKLIPGNAPVIFYPDAVVSRGRAYG